MSSPLERALEDLIFHVDAIRLEASKTRSFTEYDDHFLKMHLIEARRVLKEHRHRQEREVVARTIESDLLEDR